MRRILSIVALASVTAFSPTLQAKDKDGHGKGKDGGHSAAPQRSGGGGGGRASAPSRPQVHSGNGNIAHVQPGRSGQIQRFNAAQVRGSQVKRSSPSVALTGRSNVQERGANWNERRRKLIGQAYRQERAEDRRDAWEDHREHWEDHHDDWDNHDHHDYYVPYDVYHNWDHGQIYLWNDHRYHWYNNAWVVINPGLGYGYDDGYYYGNGGGGGGGSLTADVQEELARRGYRPGPVDGVMGPATRDALAGFQRDRGLPTTGRIDTYTLRELGL